MIDGWSSRDLKEDLRSKKLFQQIFVRILNRAFVIFDDLHCLASLINYGFAQEDMI